MDPKDFIRGFFGIPRRSPPGEQGPYQDHQDFENDENHQGHGHDRQSPFRGSFHVFTNPLEMETFFNQQFDEIMKQFGMPGFFQQGPEGHHPNEGFNFGPPNQRIPFQNEDSNESGTRDFMLKKDDHPGYFKPQGEQEMKDTIIDYIPDDFGKSFSSSRSMLPDGSIEEKNVSKYSAFSSSRSMLPDGSIEEKSVSKYSDGRETTTVSKKSDEDCFTTTTVIHPDGRKEMHESNACPKVKEFNRAFGNRRQTNDEDLIERMFRF